MAVNSFNAQNPPVTTKGDIFTFSTIPTRLGVGANNTVLTADSSTATGLKWATVAAGGKVLQVVQGSSTTSTTIASTTLSDTTLSASITPSATSSKVLVIVNQQILARTDANANWGGDVAILRGSTAILNGSGTGYGSMYFLITSNTVAKQYGNVITYAYLDSPNTTSSTTYKTQARSFSTANNGQVICQLDGAPSLITLIEIGA